MEVTLLVVDDDPGVLRMMVSALGRRGYRVVEARNGMEALQAMSGGGISLVLLDLMMPVMNGWDLLRLRAADPELLKIPVIVITANIGPETKEILDSGVSAFLPKPFDLGDLAEIVSSCLTSSRVSAFGGR
jgi:chemotaxis family two-component system sensor histidine kinase/response regulator PixL